MHIYTQFVVSVFILQIAKTICHFGGLNVFTSTGLNKPLIFQLEPDQLVLLLEMLLEEVSMATRTLTKLKGAYNLVQQNADVGRLFVYFVLSKNSIVV